MNPTRTVYLYFMKRKTTGEQDVMLTPSSSIPRLYENDWDIKTIEITMTNEGFNLAPDKKGLGKLIKNLIVS